jgi:hypothetical protein
MESNNYLDFLSFVAVFFQIYIFFTIYNDFSPTYANIHPDISLPYPS